MKIKPQIIPIAVTFCLSVWVLIEGETIAYPKGTGEGVYSFLILLVGWVLIWMFISLVGIFYALISGVEIRLFSPVSAIWIASLIVSFVALLLLLLVFPSQQ